MGRRFWQCYNSYSSCMFFFSSISSPQDNIIDLNKANQLFLFLQFSTDFFCLFPSFSIPSFLLSFLPSLLPSVFPLKLNVLFVLKCYFFFSLLLIIQPCILLYIMEVCFHIISNKYSQRCDSLQWRKIRIKSQDENTLLSSKECFKRLLI
jgi:hypothetical protein